MKTCFLITILSVFGFFASQPATAQFSPKERLELDLGLGYPDLLHVGMKYRLTHLSNVGLSYGTLFPSKSNPRTTYAVTIEHEYHFGKQPDRGQLPLFYFSQKLTYIQEQTAELTSTGLYLTPSIGKSFYSEGPFGVNLDAGLNLLVSDRYTSRWAGDERNQDAFAVVFPAVRLQFFLKI